MKVSTSLYLCFLLFLTFAFGERYPEDVAEDKEKIIQSFNKHFDEDTEAQSRLFWGSYWRNKASASIQRLKEALDRLSDNIRELTDKKFFFGGSKQSEESKGTKEGEEISGYDVADGADDDGDKVADTLPNEPAVSGAKRRGEVQNSNELEHGKKDTEKEKIIREEKVQSEKKKEIKKKIIKVETDEQKEEIMKVEKEEEKEEKIKVKQEEEEEEVKKEDMEKEVREENKVVKEDEYVENKKEEVKEEMKEDKEKEEIQKEGSANEKEYQKEEEAKDEKEKE